MPTLKQAKEKLDTIIRKARVHFYKPMQVAEILHRHRKKMADFELGDLDSYRTHSKNWRNSVSNLLVGRSSNSSAKFEDNLFEENACPPWAIEQLGTFNESKGNEGVVEAYVYKRMFAKLQQIADAQRYLEEKNVDLDIAEFINLFETKPGLKRSVDKVYEITVHALFSTIVHLLKVQVSVEYDAQNKTAIEDFKKFIEIVIGLNEKMTKVVLPAKLYRVGVTNAADRGLDMFSNFGIAVQIKHVSLSQEVAEEITEEIAADRIVIVCKQAEEGVITNIMSQVGMAERVKGIITFEDLRQWYSLILKEKKHGAETATMLATQLLRDFKEEFPSSDQVVPFMQERGYDRIKLPAGWEIQP